MKFISRNYNLGLFTYSVKNNLDLISFLSLGLIILPFPLELSLPRFLFISGLLSAVSLSSFIYGKQIKVNSIFLFLLAITFFKLNFLFITNPLFTLGFHEVFNWILLTIWVCFCSQHLFKFKTYWFQLLLYAFYFYFFLLFFIPDISLDQYSLDWNIYTGYNSNLFSVILCSLAVLQLKNNNFIFNFSHLFFVILILIFIQSFLSLVGLVFAFFVYYFSSKKLNSKILVFVLFFISIGFILLSDLDLVSSRLQSIPLSFDLLSWHFPFGVGSGQYSQELKRLSADYLNVKEHNGFILLFVENGVFSFILIIGLFCSLFIHLNKTVVSISVLFFILFSGYPISYSRFLYFSPIQFLFFGYISYVFDSLITIRSRIISLSLFIFSICCFLFYSFVFFNNRIELRHQLDCDFIDKKFVNVNRSYNPLKEKIANCCFEENNHSSCVKWISFLNKVDPYDHETNYINLNFSRFSELRDTTNYVDSLYKKYRSNPEYIFYKASQEFLSNNVEKSILLLDSIRSIDSKYLELHNQCIKKLLSKEECSNVKDVILSDNVIELNNGFRIINDSGLHGNFGHIRLTSKSNSIGFKVYNNNGILRIGYNSLVKRNIDFAVELYLGNKIRLYSNGEMKHELGTYAKGDFFNISVKDSIMELKQNNNIIYSNFIGTSSKYLTFKISNKIDFIHFNTCDF